MRARIWWAWLAVSALATGCGSKGESSASTTASAAGTVIVPHGPVIEAAENAASAHAAHSAVAAPDPTISIPRATLLAGSMPGDQGRDPALEAPLAPVEVEAFDIDRSLFPNELGSPPRTGVTRSEAIQLCAQRGRRLCHELEWELACKGPDQTAFAGGALFDPTCQAAAPGCASGYGALAMGSLREWTASDVEKGGESRGGAAVRGAPPDASPFDRRCAKRVSLDPQTSAKDLGFRCCGGEAPAVVMPRPKEAPRGFERAELPAGKLEELLKGSAQLSRLTPPVKYFDEPAAVREIERRADGGIPNGYGLSTAPLLWRPAAGEELLLAAAQAGADSFIVAFHRLPDDRFRVASVLVLKKDPGPIVLVYDRSVDKRLTWSTCWGCRGESGRITYRDDGRVVITQE